MRRLTVVIVDDHDGFRAFARDLLAMSDFEIVGEAADGRTALHEVRRCAPAVVLLDVRLPDMDGFAVARELARWAPPPTVVFVSSRDAADYGRRIVDSGVAGFISKSRLSGDTLRAIVGEPGREASWAGTGSDES